MKTLRIASLLLVSTLLSSCGDSRYVENSFFDKELLKQEEIEDLPTAPGISLLYKKIYGLTNAFVYMSDSEVSSDYASFYAQTVYEYLKEKSFKYLYTISNQNYHSAPMIGQYAYTVIEADNLDDFYIGTENSEMNNVWTFVFSNEEPLENKDGEKYFDKAHCIVIYHYGGDYTYNKKTIKYTYSIEIDTHSSFWLE